MTDPTPLVAQCRKTHEARRRLAVARGIVANERALEGVHTVEAEKQRLASARELLDDAELAVLQEEDTLRALAVAAFHATGLANVSPGITVREDRAKIGRTTTAILIPRVTLADDLGAALDAAGRRV